MRTVLLLGLALLSGCAEFQAEYHRQMVCRTAFGAEPGVGLVLLGPIGVSAMESDPAHRSWQMGVDQCARNERMAGR